MLGRKRLGQYRLDDPVRVDQPMILISQIQRSGGTLLSRLFDDHPAIFAHPYELSWGRPEKWHWPATTGSLVSNLTFAQLDQEWVHRLAKKSYYKKGPKKKVGTHPFIFDYNLQKQIFKRLAQSESINSARQSLDIYLTSFFNAWLDYQNLYRAERKFFTTAFIPRMLMFPESLEGFLRDYPDGYIVSSVRHPAGWYASAMKHKYTGDLTEVLDFWVRSTRAIIDAKQQLKDRMILTDFESVVAHPAEFTRRVCARTGLPWHETLSVPTFNGMLVKSNSHYENVTHVDEKAGQRYRTILPAREIEEIERITADLHQQALEMIRVDRREVSYLNQANGR